MHSYELTKIHSKEKLGQKVIITFTSLFRLLVQIIKSKSDDHQTFNHFLYNILYYLFFRTWGSSGMKDKNVKISVWSEGCNFLIHLIQLIL